MKKLLIFLPLAGMLACSPPSSDRELFPHYLIDEEDWVTYEGILPAKGGHEVQVELSLVPGTPGMDSNYKISESFQSEEPGNEYTSSISSRGKYTVLSSPGTSIIHLINKRKTGALFLGKASTRAEIEREYEITEDLYLKSNGDHQLILVDGDFNTVDSRYTLTRRNSPLFTAEGYFTVYDDTTDFYEKNTQKKWAVAQLGEYDDAIKKYTYLAKERFEGVYVKALSYSVVTKNREGENTDALVFKKILLIDSTRAIH